MIGAGETQSRLRDLADLRIGYQSRGRVEPDTASPYRVIQLRDVKETVDWATVISFKPERKPKRYLVGDGDVLVSFRGGAHFGVALSGVPENTVASSNFYILRIRRKDILPEYLGWYLNQPAAQEFLRTRSRGTNIALLTKADIAELEVPVPPLAVQERVVRVANLRHAEQKLLHQLESKGDQLIQAVCRNAISPTRHKEI
jgi:restriction endonuclease S subunit